MVAPLQLVGSVDIAGIGFELPVALLGLPVAIVALTYLFFVRTGEIEPSRIKKLALFTTRLAVVGLLVVGIAQPYTVVTKASSGEERVRLLVDQSASADVLPEVAGSLASDIEEEGIPVKVSRVGGDTSSPIGDAVVSNLDRNGNVLLVSDGRVTEGRGLSEAAEVAREIGAVVNAVNVSASEPEKYVHVGGPGRTSQGVEVTLPITLGGVNLGQSANRVTVRIDGNQVFSQSFRGPTTHELTHTFQTTGEHEIEARVSGGDTFSQNNVYRKTVRVVDRPRVLYVAQGNPRFERLLNELYQVESTDSVPSDLSPYYAVVTQNVPADSMGDVSALQEFVIDGNGLVVTGGPNAYEGGGYSSSVIGSMLPVKVGDAQQVSNVVLLIDISGSTREEMSLQQRLALDVVDQLGDQNRVGIVAFNDARYRVADIQRLGQNEQELETKIRQLDNSGATLIAGGLNGAAEMLGGSGNVILISDGIANDKENAIRTARQLGAGGLNIITVGVGRLTDETTMGRIAEEGGGTFVRADDTDRLQVLFGGSEQQSGGNALTIVDDNHFITSGVETASNPPRTNRVSVKGSGDFLVASSSGRPALVTGRYGLGRVVSITAYGRNGGLDGLLSRPDSLLLSRSVNWAIGNPQRKQTDVISLPDARVGEATTVRYFGSSRPDVGELEFSQTNPGEYQATLVPSEPGFASIGDARYGVNYPEEYGGFGVSPSLQRAVALTGGELFGPDDGSQIAQKVRSHASEPTEQRVYLSWMALAAALVLYFLEVVARRIREVYGLRVTSELRSRVP